jgi:5'-deoxynucleotidase
MSKIFELARDMAAITRWSQAYCLKEESVLEHTGFVAVYALRLAYKHDCDIGEVMERAIVHDMEETITGDIPTPTKYSSPEMLAMISDLSDAAAVDISRSVFFGCMYHPWKKAKMGDDPGYIIVLADIAAVVYKIWIEQSLGNHNFHKYAPNIIARLYEMNKNFPEKFHGEINNLLDQMKELS